MSSLLPPAPEPPVGSQVGGRTGPDRLGVAAVVLIALGLALWALHRFTIAGEPHAYAPGGTPPASVAVTAGEAYAISVPGGVDALRARDLEPQLLTCSVTPEAGGRQELSITPTADGSRALDQIATFVAPVTGRLVISCDGVAGVFVDDADDSPTDWSGVWLLLATISLTVGGALLLSLLRRVTAPRPSAAVGSDPPAFLEQDVQHDGGDHHQREGEGIAE